MGKSGVHGAHGEPSAFPREGRVGHSAPGPPQELSLAGEEVSITSSESLAIRPSFVEPLPRNALLDSVLRRGVWPLPSLVEKPGLLKALGGQQPHKVLRRGGKGVPLALDATVLEGKGSGIKWSQTTAGVRMR